MIAPTPTTKPIITVVPDTEPTDAWVMGMARMLLADVDRERAEEEEVITTQ